MKRKYIIIISCATLLLIVIMGCVAVLNAISESAIRAGRVEDWNDSVGTVESNLKYGSRTNNIYDLYIPKHQTKDGVLLFIHGGSWMGGDKSEMEYACRRYAKMGYVTATMNYSFINSKTEYGSMPIMDNEVISCIKSIINKLDKRNIRVNNLAVGGFSAGAQIAATYARKHGNDSPIPLRFAIIESGPMHLSKMFPVDETKLAQIRKAMAAGETNIEGKTDLDNLVMNASGVTLLPNMYTRLQLIR